MYIHIVSPVSCRSVSRKVVLLVASDKMDTAWPSHSPNTVSSMMTNTWKI